MSASIVIDVAIDIDAPREEVWPHLVDWERIGSWMKEASGVRLLSRHREGVGVQAQATIKIAGFRTKDVVKVEVWRPPELLVVEHHGWVAGRGSQELVSVEHGTRVLWREELEPPMGMIGAAGMRLLKGRMRRVFARDLRLLKQIVEGGTQG